MQDLSRRAHLDQAAVLEDRDAVTYAHGLIEVVGDKDDGLVQGLLQFQQLVLHLRADQRIERTEGLVHQDDVGVCRQGTGQAHTLTHAARELVRVFVFVAFQAHGIDPVQRTLGAHLLALATHFQAVGDIVDHGLVRQQAEALEHHADLVPAKFAQGFHVVLQDVHAVHQDRAAGGVDQAVEVAHQGRFAGTRQAHDHEDFAGADAQRQVVHTDHAAGFGQHLILGFALANHAQRVLGAVAENLEDVFDFDFAHGCVVHLLTSCRGRPYA